MAQGSEEPPFLKVGTEVSAKYRGAFCEASIKAIKKHVKCKIQYKDSTTATLTDDVVKGDLKVGSNVEVKSLDGRIMDGVITKLTDASIYTVVFDDGDERTLRRSSLCLKGERHFNESETLDHLPLTDPENFGTPVIQNGKKRKKRRPINQQNTSIDEAGSEKEDTTPVPAKKKCLFNEGIVGKVVVVERGTRRKSHWFPALGVSPSPENMSYIKTKDQCLARSFKDGNYHVVSIRDTKEFAKDQDPVGAALRTDNRASKPAIERAIAYMETGRVPSIWEGNKSEVITHDDVDDESKRSGLRTNKTTASSDDENEVTSEDADKEPFMEKLQSFMGEKGTPITRSPILGNQDLDLHKLYLLVIEAGGMDEVTKKQEWRSIYSKMGIAIMPPSASHHIKMAYKKYLYPYETHETSMSTCGLGKESDEDIPAEVSMTKKEKSLNGRTRHERNSKSLTRQGTAEKSEKLLSDKRSKQVSSEKVDAQEKSITPVKVASSNKSRRSSTPNKPATSKQSSTTPTIPPGKPLVPNKLSLSSTFTAPPSKQVTTPIGKSTVRPVALSKAVTPDTSKELIPVTDKTEIKKENENGKEMKVEIGDVLKQDEDHVVEERSFKQEDSLESDIDVDENVTSPESELAVDVVNSPGCMSDTSESRSDSRSEGANEEANDCIVGDKIQVKYGRGRNRRLYEAKIVTVDPDAEEGLLYLIHYTGWNIRYDEWISPDRVLGKSDKLSKRKGPGMKEFQRSKIPPKPIGKQYIRSHIKRGTKSPSPASPSPASPSPASPSPASPNSKPGETKANNGHKASQRDSPLLQITEPLSAKPAVRSSPPSRRTRSERNSISSVTNGLDEAVKSPPPKRRQKSVTPEPSDISKHQPDNIKETSTLDSSVTEGSRVIPECNQETEHLNKIENEPSNEEINQESTTDIDLLCNIKNELKSDELEKSNDQNNLHCSKLRAWSTLPNGLTSYSSSDSGSPGNSEHDTEPAAKKIQLVKEKDIANEDIRNLLSSKVECKSPIAAPHSEGSCSSDEQLVCLSADEDDRKISMQAKTENNLDLSANCLSGTEVGKGESPSSIGKDEIKCEKKDGDQKSKRNRKKRERKRQRHQSVNDNNSDGPGSPACSPSSKASPSRPKITFDAELESIKSMEDGSERIRLLQVKVNEMRKVYGSLKAEVATIDRRRKKLKKKREENAGSSSHESNSKSSPSHCVSPSPAPVECR